LGKNMSFAFMPFYTGDYYRDTRHLSMLQHGAYRQLLDHCWDQKGPLPLDLEKCYRICGAVSKEEQDCVRGIVEEFFIKMDDGHYNKRMAEEVAKAERYSEASRQGGLKSAELRRDKARAGAREKSTVQVPLKGGSSTVQVPLVSPSPSPSLEPQPKKTEDSGSAQALIPPISEFFGDSNETQIPKTAKVLIAMRWELPSAWGEDAERLGWRPKEILHESEKYRQYWTTGKGAGTRRGVKGWRQSWSNWLVKAENFRGVRA
jgi:uncharacterized protein YdaU (DUF1376 family)